MKNVGRCSEMPDTISKRTTQESFQQSLVEIGSVVSEEMIFFLISSPLAYITGFFMNFELLPILTDYANLKKGGMKIKKSLLL
jgi:hypothetical protein